MKQEIISKIESKKCVVGVIGLGYVGLPLLQCFVEKGFSSIGFDIDVTKVKAIQNGTSYIKHISSKRIQNAIHSGKLEVSTEFSKISLCDFIIITVPTPLNKNREPDVSYIVSTCEAIRPFLRINHVVILESTTYPGTTEDLMIPILEKSGLKVNEDFYVAFSPEREDPNNPDYTTETIPKVIGSTSSDGLMIVDTLYKQIIQHTVPVSSAKVAEATKLMENIFRAVNIALVNELKVTFMEMGINIWEVIEAAKTKPFGYMPFYPGPGWGGHCIPIDPFYLTWKAREYSVTTKFIELAGEINTFMPDFVVSRVIKVLNIYGKPLRGSRILMLGLAYKANVDDDRESPSYHLMKKMEQWGAIVDYNDPYIPVIKQTREFPEYSGRKSVEITDQYDLLLIATAHDIYRDIDFAKILVPIVDTRNLVNTAQQNVYPA